jgi:hypothetical protein
MMSNLPVVVYAVFMLEQVKLVLLKKIVNNVNVNVVHPTLLEIRTPVTDHRSACSVQKDPPTHPMDPHRFWTVGAMTKVAFSSATLVFRVQSTPILWPLRLRLSPNAVPVS